MTKKKVIPVIARFSKEDAADLRDVQKLTGRSQADSLRFSVRTTARALRVAEVLQSQGGKSLTNTQSFQGEVNDE